MNRWKISIILMIAVTAIAGTAFAVPTQIGALEQNVQGPVRVAVDSQGSVYITEAQHNAVVIFNNKGQYRTSFSLPAAAGRPLGIAVDANGTIYVGSGNLASNNGVYLYGPDLAPKGCLGGACNGFGKPIDITIDAAGRVYVTDSHPDTSVVKVFDGGALVATIAGSGATRLRKPMAAAVNDATGEVYIADAPVATITASDKPDSARIQVFDRTGAFQRTVGQYAFATNASGLKYYVQYYLTDLALGNGVLYVVDAHQHLVHIVNTNDGSITGSLYELKGLGGPNSIAISRNNIAYVVMQSGRGSVEVFALDGSVTMSVSPAALTFEARQFSGNPAGQTLSIANNGSGTLNWTAAADPAKWIGLSQAQGTAGPGSAATLGVSLDISTLTVGSHSGAVTVSSDFGQQETVGVTVHVIQPLILNLSSGWLDFTAKKGRTAAPKTVQIGIDNVTAPVSWTAKSDSTWLSISPAAGAATATAPSTPATVSVNTAGMGVGTMSGLITVSAPGAIGNNSTITVSVTITPTNKITVATNRTDAKFTVSGPAAYSGAGTSWSAEDAPAGSYTVAFDAVPGYRKPATQTKTVASDGETAFSGSYDSWKDLAARKNIVVAKGPGATNDGLIKAYRNSGAPVASFDLVALATQYGANLAVGDVDGDGAAELIVGAGDGPNNPATVRIFRADKTMLLEFVPLGTLYGVRVAAADLDGDGMAEVIAAPAGGPENSGTVAVYTFDAASVKMVPTGIELAAFASFYGASVAGADIDGDGKAELVAAPGFARQNPGMVRVWKADTAKGVGSWTASLLNEFSLAETYGAVVASGDVDGDGRDEIIAGTGNPAKTDGASITVIKADGTQTKFSLAAKRGVRNMSLAAADLNGDGSAEIIASCALEQAGGGKREKDGSTASGKNMNKDKDADKGADGAAGDDESGMVRVYSPAGALQFTLAPFENLKDGVTVAVGSLGL